MFRDEKSKKIDEPRLYHCTVFESLCKILNTSYFRCSYCLEQSNFMDEYSEGAYAMVCFADLQSKELGQHMRNFNSDSYIMMKKDWALRNIVSPVQYYFRDTIPAITMKVWVEYLLKQQNEWENGSLGNLLNNATNMMFAYMKQYKGSYFNRKTRTFSNEERLFYLEREWRYVPLVENGEAYYLTKEEYLNENVIKAKTAELVERGCTLKFSLEDVIEIGIPKGMKSRIRKNIPNSISIKEILK